MSKRKEYSWRAERKKVGLCRFYEPPNICHLMRMVECITHGNPNECGAYESELRTGDKTTVKELTRMEKFYQRYPNWTIMAMKMVEGLGSYTSNI